jgi:hypothetical protein
MKRFAIRSIASAAMVATLALGTPVVAFAGNNTTTTTTFSSLHAYQTSEHAYRTQLKAINLAFIEAIAVAKSDYQSALATATSSADRITARAAMRLAIANATAARASALTALGKPPVKPHKFGSSFH